MQLVVAKCVDEKTDIDAYDRNRKLLYESLTEYGFECIKPEGAFYLFPDIRKFNMTSEEFALRLLNEEKVVVVPGNAVGDSGEGFLRISYAYSIDDLKKALERLQRFIEKL